MKRKIVVILSATMFANCVASSAEEIEASGSAAQVAPETSTYAFTARANACGHPSRDPKANYEAVRIKIRNRSSGVLTAHVGTLSIAAEPSWVHGYGVSQAVPNGETTITVTESATDFDLAQVNVLLEGVDSASPPQVFFSEDCVDQPENSLPLPFTDRTRANPAPAGTVFTTAFTKNCVNGTPNGESYKLRVDNTSATTEVFYALIGAFDPQGNFFAVGRQMPPLAGGQGSGDIRIVGVANWNAAFLSLYAVDASGGNAPTFTASAWDNGCATPAPEEGRLTPAETPYK